MKAIESMAEMNPGFSIERSECGLHFKATLGATDAIGGGELGQILLTGDSVDMAIKAVLPVSGTKTYGFNSSSGRWVCKNDGHDLEGIIVRDLLRQCRGCPSF